MSAPVCRNLLFLSSSPQFLAGLQYMCRAASYAANGKRHEMAPLQKKEKIFSLHFVNVEPIRR